MLKTLVTTLITGMALIAAEDAATTATKDKKGRIANRKERQQDRIGEGVKDGSLTAKETTKIEAREAKLNQKIREDRKDGKGLTAKEKAKIEARQDKISKDIYKEKHDKQKQ